MKRWAWAALLAVASSMPSAASAANNSMHFVAHGRTGIAAGYEFLGADPRFTGRLGLGAGFLDLRTGSGLLVDANLTGGQDPGLSFVDALRLEVSLHLWTSKGALRLFGGSRLDTEAPFGGVAYGFPIPIPASGRVAVAVIPEVGLWIGEGAFGDVDALVQVQVIFDVYFLVQ